MTLRLYQDKLLPASLEVYIMSIKQTAWMYMPV